jgi:hypothetical protein
MNAVRPLLVAACISALSPLAMGQLTGSLAPPPPPVSGPAGAADVQTGTVEVQIPPGGTELTSAGAPALGTPLRLQFKMTNNLVKAAYLGIAMMSDDATLQSQLNLPEGVGLVVREIMPDSPAAAAGLKKYDVIYKFDDQIAVDPGQFEVLVRMHKPGDSVELTVIRQAQPLKITAKLTEMEQPDLSWFLMSRNSTSFQEVSVPSGSTMTLQGGNDINFQKHK